MRFRCTEDCYFLSNLWKRNDLVEGDQFAANKHFAPQDEDAVIEAESYGRTAELPKPEKEIVPDPELMAKSVNQLRSVYPMVEWRMNMRKPEFVKSIMEYKNGK